MSRYPLDRRQFLTLPLKLFLAPLLVNTAPWRAHAGPETRRTAYDVDVGVLWDAMTFHLPGALEEAVDRAAGRYEITALGEGSKIQHRAEIVPLAMKVASEPETGKAAASLDLTRFSSWAKERQPARVIFGPDRRPESITASLILGTSITIRFRGQA